METLPATDPEDALAETVMFAILFPFLNTLTNTALSAVVASLATYVDTVIDYGAYHLCVPVYVVSCPA